MKLTFTQGLIAILLLTKVAMTTAAASNQEPTWRNVPVINQHGQRLRFYQDLIKGKIVAINFIFTTCSSSCPLATAVFKQVQTQVGLQKIHLISVSVDPNADTPARLQAFAQQFNIKTGWNFITGERSEIMALLKILAVYTPDKTLHTNMVLIGNDVTHAWTRLYGLPSAEAIVSAVKQIAAQPADVSAVR